jgi:hypothetical protein
MMRNPRALINYQITGRLPAIPCLESPSPLAQLLLSIDPRDLLQIGPANVGSALGYRCRNSFRNAQQALNWLYPAHSNESSSPANSYRDRPFEIRHPKLGIEDLAEHFTIPDQIKSKYRSR